MLSPPFLRLLLIVLLPAYFSFLFVSFVADRRLASFCASHRLVKDRLFIASSYVPQKDYKATLVRLEAIGEGGRSYAIWLKTWRFISHVFLVVMIVFVCLAMASMMNVRVPYHLGSVALHRRCQRRDASTEVQAGDLHCPA